ncbi:MAG: hypothetical protein KDA50_06415 [Rhodobacteraceae bacterium]|nr:hypothetical protein [Paracoccaceae bacterium]
MSRQADHRITLRLKPDEYAQITAKAGDIPLSTFIRQTALGASANTRAKPQRRVTLETALAAQLLARLGQHDLIQDFKAAAKDVEDGTLDTDDARLLRIDACHAMLSDIRALLMEALGRSGS